MDSGPRNNASQEDVVVITCKVGQMVHWKSQQPGRSLLLVLPSSMSIEGFHSIVVVCASFVSDGSAFLGRFQSFGELCIHCCTLVHVHSMTSTMISLKTSVCCQNMPGWTFLAFDGPNDFYTYSSASHWRWTARNRSLARDTKDCLHHSLFRNQNETLGECWSCDLKIARDGPATFQAAGLGSGNRGYLNFYGHDIVQQIKSSLGTASTKNWWWWIPSRHTENLGSHKRIGCTCPLDQLYRCQTDPPLS